jgi:hypothetical protein
MVHPSDKYYDLVITNNYEVNLKICVMEIPNIVLIVLAHGIVFAILCSIIGAQKEIGALAGAFLGLFFGIIGLIIILFCRRKEPVHFTDQLQNYKTLFDSGSITETEYNHLKGRLIEQQ